MTLDLCIVLVSAEKALISMADKENKPLRETRSYRWVSDSHGHYVKVSVDVPITSQYHNIIIS